MKCEYCEKEFSTKYVLLNHQKTAKSCQKLQTELSPTTKPKYSCLKCQYKTNRKDHLNKHTTTCVYMDSEHQLNEKDETIKNLKEEILLLKKELEVVYKFQERSASCIEEIAKHKKINNPIQLNGEIKEDPIKSESKLSDDNVRKCNTPKLLECKFVLSEGKEFFIPIRKDGYVNITALCKSVGKEYKHWKENSDSNEIIAACQRSVGIPTDLLIEQIKTGPNHLRGTFVHRRLALVIAQWANPDLAIQVAKWTEELLIAGSVSMKQEISNENLNILWDEKLEEQNTRLKKSLARYEKVHHYHKFNIEKPSYYIISEPLTCSDDCKRRFRFKHGIAATKSISNLDNRLASHRTTLPFLTVDFIVVADFVDKLETCMENIFNTRLNPTTKEWFDGEDSEHLKDKFISCVKFQLDIFSKCNGNAEYKILSKTELEEYNKDVKCTVI